MAKPDSRGLDPAIPATSGTVGDWGHWHHIDAGVVLPDHVHRVWTRPDIPVQGMIAVSGSVGALSHKTQRPSSRKSVSAFL